jgi:ribonuclease E
VDVNSARATRGNDIETTAFNTNLEAAEEVARQLRLRDLGGLIVIDFIDMENAKNQREVEGRLKDALRYDRARVQMGKISRFGLMELSRQRLRPSLSEGSHVTCPRCNGTGHIRDTESSALQVLRIIQEEAMKENSAAIHVQAPVDVAAFLLNEKRGEILKIETRHRVSIILIPNKHLETPHYKLERIKHDDPRLEESQASYDMAEQADTDISYSKRQKEDIKPRQEAMVKGITPDQPAPIIERKQVEVTPVPAVMAPAEEGFFSKIFGLFRKKVVAPIAAAPAPVVEEKPQQNRERGERNGRGQRNRNRGRGARDKDEERNTAGVEGREESAKPAQAEPVAQTARPPRPPREPRESREARELREPREPRDGNENRRERAERQPRPSREERKEVASTKTDESLVNSAAVSAASSSLIAPIAAVQTPIVLANPTGAEESVTGVNGMEEENGEQGEERRRRRRRGGRNRNRRDRENGEGIESANGPEATEGVVIVEETSRTEIVLATPDATIEISATEIMSASTDIPAVPAATSMAEVSKVESTPEPTVEAAPEATVSAEPEAVTAPAEPAEPLAVPEEPASALIEPVAEMPIQHEISFQPEPVAPTEKAAQETIAVEASVATVPAPTATAAVEVIVNSASMQQATLHDVLSAAGLTLASTDPEKLRAAQEAAAKIAPLPRVPRERKPLPPQSTEPLVQVETRR